MKAKAPFRIETSYEQRNFPYRISTRPRIKRVRVTRCNGQRIREEVYRGRHYVQVWRRPSLFWLIAKVD